MGTLRCRDLMLLLGLLAALASTPLRLVEAASDQARTIAELEGGVSIEPIDGGVGDDSDASIRAEVVHDRNFGQALPGDWLAEPRPAQRLDLRRWHEIEIDRPPRWGSTLQQRLAALQRLRI